MDLYLYTYYGESVCECCRSVRAIRPLVGTEEEAKQLEAMLNKMNPDPNCRFAVESDEIDLDPAGGTGPESHR
jgi:hypothetical protein